MKKGALILILLYTYFQSYAATRTIANGGGNYNSTSTWVEGAVPTSADDVVATSTSGKLVVNVSSAAKTLILTNYTDSLILNTNLSVSGTVTLASGMKYAGNGSLICLTTATLTSNGIIISGGLQLNGTSQTYTLADNWTVNGLLTCAGTTATTINGNMLTCNGGYTQTTVATVSGTTNFVLGGGTWTSTTASNVLRNNLTFAGDVSLASNVAYNTGTLTYTSGTITTAASTLTCVLGTTFNCKPIGWSNIVLGGVSQTYILSDTLDVNGLLNCNGSTATTVNGYVLKLGGGYAQSVASLSGTTKFVFDGKGTWSGSSTAALRSDVVIGLSDTLAIGPNIAYNTGTFTYISGVVKTTGSTLTIGATTNLSYGIDSIGWNNITFAGSNETYTLGRKLFVNGTLDFAIPAGGAYSFSGAYDLICGNLNIHPTGGSPRPTINLVGDIRSSGLFKIFANSWWGIIINGNKTIYTSSLEVLSGATLSGNCGISLTGGGTWTGPGGIYNLVTFDGNTTLVGAIGCSSLNYVSGTITTSGSTMVTSGTATLNTAGIVWENFTFANNSTTVTLTSDMDVNGTVAIAVIGSPVFVTINGYNIHCWSLTYGYPQNRASINGTTNFIMDGTGVLEGDEIGNAVALYNNLTFNTTGTITATGGIDYGSGTITYVSGTMNMANSTLTSPNAGVGTLNTSGMTWGNIYIYIPYILASDCNVGGTLTVNSGGTFYGAYSFKCSGNLIFDYNSVVYPLSGPTKWLMNGKGTLSCAPTTEFNGDLTINTTDTITFGNINLKYASFTYSAGTIISSGSTFKTSGASTININGAGFNLDNYTSTATQSFGGSNGFSIKNFNCTAPGATFTFASGKTYSINNSLTIAGTSSSRVSFVSSTPGTQATVTIGSNATEDVAFCNATDIKSDLGQRIWSYKGVLSNSPGWLQLPTEPRTLSYTF